MERRDFLKASCCTGLASLTGASVALGQIEPRRPNETATQYAQRVARERALAAPRTVGTGRQPNETATEYAQRVARERALMASGVGTRCYALWRYTLDSSVQRERLDTFVEGALIPALNRAGIDQVGVFIASGGLGISPVYVLLNQTSVGNMTSLSMRLAWDKEYAEMATAFLHTSADNRPYRRKDVQLVMSLTKAMEVEAPAPGEKPILQLHSYECFDVETENEAIKMFNATGISILCEAGVSPIFFGQTIAGEGMPNLTCLLAAADDSAHESAGRKLMAQTQDKITELVYTTASQTLRPTAYSQI